MRVRVGPFSVSSSGRVGARAGPVSVYGGGRRHRRKKSSGGSGIGAILLVLILLGLAIEYWYVALPILALFILGAMLSAGADSKLKEQRALEEAAGRREAEAQRLSAQQAWLKGRPPPLVPPGRFSETWFAENIPKMHPGQIPMLFVALRSRGWSDDKINERLAHHLARNEFSRSSAR
jgi:hypothetical protein